MGNYPSEFERLFGNEHQFWEEQRDTYIQIMTEVLETPTVVMDGIYDDPARDPWYRWVLAEWERAAEFEHEWAEILKSPIGELRPERDYGDSLMPFGAAGEGERDYGDGYMPLGGADSEDSGGSSNDEQGRGNDSDDSFETDAPLYGDDIFRLADDDEEGYPNPMDDRGGRRLRLPPGVSSPITPRSFDPEGGDGGNDGGPGPADPVGPVGFDPEAGGARPRASLGQGGGSLQPWDPWGPKAMPVPDDDGPVGPAARQMARPDLPLAWRR